MKKEKIGDISKTTITVLLIVTILVSVVGTWSVLDTMDNIIKNAALKPASSIGQVKVTITEPTETATETANVRVTILPSS